MITIEKVPYRKGHRYFVKGDERVDPALPLVSCSTAARHADSGGDGLQYWAAGLALATGKKGAFKESNEKAIAIGNDLHAEIEEHIATGEQPKNPSALFGAWYSSMQERGIEWLASELKLYHPDLLYAGQCDAIGIVDDEVTLFDWKTTNGLDKDGKRKRLKHPNHATQVGGYWLALSRDRFEALQLHPDTQPGGYWPFTTSNQDQDMVKSPIPNVVGYAAPDAPELPIPTRVVICYVLKDTLKVEWRYINPYPAARAFIASLDVYNSTKESLLYE